MPLITTRPARICSATRRARAEIFAAYEGVETIFGIIGDLNGIGLGVVGDDGQYRAEDLFLCDRHVVRDVHKHCRLHEEATFEPIRVTFAADQHFGALFDALTDVRLDAVVLSLRRRWPDTCLWIRRVAGGKGAHRLDDRALGFFKPVAWHEQARSGGAGLATVHERDAERQRNRLVEICVVEQNVGRLAAQLERDALHRCGGIAHDPLAHGDRACERDFGHVRIAHEFGADDAA